MGEVGIRHKSSMKTGQDLTLNHVCTGLFTRGKLYKSFRLITVVALALLSACQPTSPHLRKQVEADLQMCSLEESDLPNGWKRYRSGTSNVPALGLPGNALGGIRTEFVGHWAEGDGFVVHEILAYRTYHRAIAVYGQSPSAFYHANRITPWLEIELSEIELSAEAFRVGCAYFETLDSVVSEKTCHFLARYGRFVTKLHMSTSPEPMSEEEMIQSVQVVDERMSKCVDAYKDAVWEEKVE